jgi:hypothetical protein
MCRVDLPDEGCRPGGRGRGEAALDHSEKITGIGIGRIPMEKSAQLGDRFLE